MKHSLLLSLLMFVCIYASCTKKEGISQKESYTPPLASVSSLQDSIENLQEIVTLLTGTIHDLQGTTQSLMDSIQHVEARDKEQGRQKQMNNMRDKVDNYQKPVSDTTSKFTKNDTLYVMTNTSNDNMEIVEIIDKLSALYKLDIEKKNQKQTLLFQYLLPSLISFFISYFTILGYILISQYKAKKDTAKILISKRLECYPLLHEQTDKLGEAIRYYNIAPSNNKLKKLIQQLNVFHLELAKWDAKYCVFAGRNTTDHIGILRQRLEKKNWTEENLKNLEGEGSIFQDLLKIEDSLKDDMAIFFTESKKTPLHWIISSIFLRNRHQDIAGRKV